MNMLLHILLSPYIIYDALINDRPYKRKYEPEEAIQMISNGECGAFSNQLMQCFQEAAKQQNWLKRQN